MNETQAERLLIVLERIAARLEGIGEHLSDLSGNVEQLADCVSTDGDETVFQIWKVGESE